MLLHTESYKLISSSKDKLISTRRQAQEEIHLINRGIIAVRKRSCWKVMFLLLFVCPREEGVSGQGVVWTE